MSKRKVVLERKTRETKVEIRMNLDGTGKFEIDTGIPFFDHMLSVFAKHGKIDLKLKTRGDLEIDEHHTVEDTGIVLGASLLRALGDKKGISRFGYAYCPMDESLVLAAVDVSGRPYLHFGVEFRSGRKEKLNSALIEEFMRGFASESKITLHINLIYGKNNHHIMEAIFKALGLALDMAARINPGVKTVPSTKGSLL